MRFAFALGFGHRAGFDNRFAFALARAAAFDNGVVVFHLEKLEFADSCRAGISWPRQASWRLAGACQFDDMS